MRPEIKRALQARIDSHQHFWKYSPSEHIWMAADMGMLKRDYLPNDLRLLLDEIGFAGSIAVQARQSLAETSWLLTLAEDCPNIFGVVGWVDLQSARVEDQLRTFADNPRLVGVRHVVHDEPDDEFILGPGFQHGISLLKDFDLAYDLLLFPRHLKPAVELVKRFPQQRFVLDHSAKPRIAEMSFSPWREDLNELAQFPNVFCKLSGFVTEARWGDWTEGDIRPYLDIVTEAFGDKRLMIGSDWPVCTLSGSYQSTMGLVIRYIEQFPQAIQSDILGGNCARFYKIGQRFAKETV
jgi:L-fuconolactonase